MCSTLYFTWEMVHSLYPNPHLHRPGKYLNLKTRCPNPRPQPCTCIVQEEGSFWKVDDFRDVPAALLRDPLAGRVQVEAGNHEAAVATVQAGGVVTTDGGAEVTCGEGG